MKSYTTSVLDAFAAQSIDIQLISIGNEISAGLLWPTGKSDQIPTMVKLINAGIAGVKASKISSKPKIMLHLNRGYSWSTQEWFYDAIIAAGFDMSTIDIQGLSCYPFWDATESTLVNFKTNMNNLAVKYKKGIVCAETDWPTQCTKASANIPSSLTSSIPFSAAGQVTWVKKLAAIVKAVPNGLGMGVMYWEPAWINNQVSFYLRLLNDIVLTFCPCRHWAALASRACSFLEHGVAAQRWRRRCRMYTTLGWIICID